MKQATAMKDKFDLYEQDEQIMRLGFGLTLFLPKPFREVQKSIRDLWDKYLSLVGKDTFTWARLGGGNRSRKISPAVFSTIETWLSGEKDYGGDCWISIHDGPMDGLGQNSFRLEGLNQAGYDMGFLEIEFPLSFAGDKDPILLFKQITQLVAGVPFLTGVAGFFFHRSPYKLTKTIGAMASLSKRFEGVEVTANESMCYWAGEGLTTVNWITFVGDKYLQRLGGREAVQHLLPDDCSAADLQHGMALRAGAKPVVGDRNRAQDELVALRHMYQTLRPIQYVDDECEFDSENFDAERTVRWLRRFDS